MPPDLSHISAGDPEIKKEVTVNLVGHQDNATTTLIEYYSSWKKLLRAAAWLLKVKNLLLQRHKGKVLNLVSIPKDKFQGLDVEDLDEAEKSIIRYEQQCYLDPEMALLKMGKPVKTGSSIYRLDPIIDEGILKVGGRIGKAPMPVSLKNTIILPKDSHISKLILRDVHQQVGHSGRNHMLSRLQQKFWLPSANSCAREIIKSCVFCR